MTWEKLSQPATMNGIKVCGKLDDTGIVVRLLDIGDDGAVDTLDANGNGLPDGLPDDLDGDGEFDNEVVGLTDSGTYPPDATLWRVEVSHFTPYDFN